MYYFINWIKSKSNEGYEPDIPDKIDFCLIAENKNEKYKWGIFECWVDEEEYEEVSERLNSLLSSATKYPPVMALSKKRIEKESLNLMLTKMQFDEKFSAIIENTIEECKNKKLIFACSKTDEAGYLSKNEYYWVYSAIYNEAGALVVSWVSGDYFFYINPASDFCLSGVELKALKANA